MIKTGYLNEVTRLSLLNKSQRDTPERVTRRLESGKNWTLKRVGLIELSVTNNLYVYFTVKDYNIKFMIEDFKDELTRFLSGTYKNDIDEAITRALNYCIKHNKVRVSCSCPDFKYRFAYMATQKNYGLDTDENRPAVITNPNNKGGLCKHLIKILKIPSLWKPQVVLAVKGYIRTYKGGSE